MKKFASVVVASAAFAAMAVGSAQATPILFDFSLVNIPTHSTVGVPSITYTVGGLSVVASGQVGNVSATKPVPVRPTNSGGLGVISYPGDSAIVDGTVVKDLLNLVFSKKVKIFSAVFTEIETGDDFGFFIDNSYNGKLTIPVISKLYTFAMQEGTKFGFGAIDINDDFKLKSVSVSPVPLPPALLLFASGLFGIGLLGRRRNKTV
jgi:hypothetical protein